MNDQMVFDARLSAAFDAYADRAPVDVDATRLAAAIVRSQRRTVYVLGRTFAPPRWLSPIAVALMLLAALIAAAYVGAVLINQRHHHPYVGVRHSVGFGAVGPDSVVELRDGRILGSRSSGTDAPIILELLDPATGEVRPAGQGLARRASPAMVELPSGKVLIVASDYGPLTDDGWAPTSPTTAEIYDPATQTSAPAGPMIEARFWPTVIPLLDGRVLVAGGSVPADDLIGIGTAEIYDPATNQFSAASPMIEPRFQSAAVLLSDGRVLLVGTSFGDRSASQTAEIFDPISGRFEATDGPIHPGFVRGTELGDGRALFVHGFCDEIHAIGADGFSESAEPVNAEIYDLSRRSFIDAPQIPHCVSNLVGLPDGRAFVSGYYYARSSGQSDTQITWSGIYDPGDGSIQEIPGPLGYLPHAAGLSDGRVLIWPGGIGQDWAEILE